MCIVEMDFEKNFPDALFSIYIGLITQWFVAFQSVQLAQASFLQKIKLNLGVVWMLPQQ